VWKSINGGTTFKPSSTGKGRSRSARWSSIVQRQERLGRHRGVVDAEQRIDRRRDLQVDRRRRELEERRAQGLRAHLADPRDPRTGNTVYACVTGHLWDDSAERGVYKTTDGGQSWRKVLAGANLSTGCGMIALSSQDPRTLYASTWDFRRQDGPSAPAVPAAASSSPPTPGSTGAS